MVNLKNIGFTTNREGPIMISHPLNVKFVVPILTTGASALGFFALSMLWATPIMA